MKNLLIIAFLSVSILANAQFPTSFNLVDSGFVTSVKSQQGGTCWTHGTMASIESNLLVNGNWTANGETGDPNLAEYHLDWWNGFNKYYNADLGGENDICLDVHMGGDYRVASAYLSRGDGAVRDIDGQSYDTPPDFYQDTYHIYYPREIWWLTTDDATVTIDSIKKQLMQYGAVATCMYYNSQYIDDNYNHYQPASSPYLPNHSVTIVGWDDNHYVPDAGQNGAWFVKNSWGEGWGLNGYFWISYYDKWAGKEPDMGAVSFVNVEPKKYSKIYYHDYHGWRDTKTDINEACNAFFCRDDQWITAVSFFTDTADVDYKIKIFLSIEADSFRNAATLQTGHVFHRGFHTVDLDVPVHLNPNENFYVYLYLSKGGQAYDRTSLVPVLLDDTLYKQPADATLVPSAASEGESFYYLDSTHTWYDFYFYNDPSGYDSTGNFCIKALAEDSVNHPEIGAMFHILNKNTNQGVNNALVTFDTLTSTSDRQGDAFFANITNFDSVNVSITATNYRNFDTTVFISDTTLLCDIYLTPLNSYIEQMQDNVIIYPQPVSNILKVSTNAEIKNYFIYDISGRKIMQGGKNAVTIDVSGLKSGVYYIELQTNQGKITKKFIKK